MARFRPSSPWQKYRLFTPQPYTDTKDMTKNNKRSPALPPSTSLTPDEAEQHSLRFKAGNPCRPARTVRFSGGPVVLTSYSPHMAVPPPRTS